MEKYIQKITPNVSDIWRADELYMKFKGDRKYVFALMDDETRYWIAQEVAQTKDTHDAKGLLKMGEEAMGKKPHVLITDGLQSYADAYKELWYTHNRATQTRHIRHITIQGDRNNNKMERLNGEIRDREKVMRGLENEDTPILRAIKSTIIT